MGLYIPKAHSELVLPPEASSNTQRAWFFGDVHLNSMEEGDSALEHGRVFAEHLAEDVIPKVIHRGDKNEDLLIINGDFFDFSESFIWDHEALPYNGDKTLDHEKNLETFSNISNAHQATVKQINEFLNSKENTKVVFTFGNHDHLLLVDDKLRAIFQKQFLPEASSEERDKRIQFTKSLKIPKLKAQVEHGHRIDPFDFSTGIEANDGDYLSYVKVMVVKNIVGRLTNISDKKIPKEVADKMINEVMKVDFIRDAKAFPLYLKRLAQKYYTRYKKEKGSEVANEVYKTVMDYKNDFVDLIKETPLLGLIGKLPNRLLKSKIFEEFFLLRLQYIYEQQTHKNILQLNDAKKLHENDPHYVNYLRGHTHIHGTEYESSTDPEEQKIQILNNGTWIPLIQARKEGNWLTGRTHFDKTRYPEQGVVITADLNGGSKSSKAIKVTTHSVQRSYSKA